MRKIIGIGAALMLASGVMVATAATGDGQVGEHPTRGKKIVAADKPEPGTLVKRRLAVLDGGSVELGISVKDVDASGNQSGAAVEEVREDSPAAKAGLKEGDIITTFDGERVRSARQLARLVRETPAGRTVPLEVMRDGKTMQLSATPEEGRLAGRDWVQPGFSFQGFGVRPRDFALLERTLPDLKELEGRRFEFFLAPDRLRLGVTIQSLTPQLAEYFGAKNGVLVSRVEPDSPAAAVGLKAGDVITAVNGEAVDDPGELTEKVRQAEPGSTLEISYLRERREAKTTATLPSEKAAKRRQVVRSI